MKKLSFILSFVILLPASIAFAQTASQVQTNVKADADVRASGQSGEAQDDNGMENSANVNTRDDAGIHGTGTATLEEEDKDASTSINEDDQGEDGQAMSEEHQSIVAAFVKSLLEDSDRDEGIGADVRAVARSQEDSASTTVDAIEKIESRNKFMTFLFGNDWKSLGMLRSEIAKGDADVRQLTTALAQTTDASVRADLQAQLAVLKAEQAKIEAFADAHANVFSLFGWFAKLFVSSDTNPGQ